MIVLSADDCGTSKLLRLSSSRTADSETQQNHCHNYEVTCSPESLAAGETTVTAASMDEVTVAKDLRILLACVGEPILALFVAYACVGQDGLEFWQLTCQFAPDGRLTLCSSPAATPLVRRIYIQRT